MWPDRVSNPGPLALESDALPTFVTRLGKYIGRYSSFKPLRVTGPAVLQISRDNGDILGIISHISILSR